MLEFTPFHENPEILHVKTCENRSYYIPCAPGCSLKKAGGVRVTEWIFAHFNTSVPKNRFFSIQPDNDLLYCS